MDRKPTIEEWMDLLRPLLAQFHKRAARKKLCQMHRNGPVKESKVYLSLTTGGNCFATINAQRLKIWLILPNGGSVYMEYAANGHQINGAVQPTGDAGSYFPQEEAEY